jgi:hypothetical protein
MDQADDAIENYYPAHTENLEKIFEAIREHLDSSTPWQDYLDYHYYYGLRSEEHAISWLNRDHAVRSILPRSAIRTYETERAELNDSFDEILNLCHFYNLQSTKTEEVIFKRYIVAVAEERYDSVMGAARWGQPGVEMFVNSLAERDMSEEIEEILQEYKERGSWVGRLVSHDVMDLLLDTHGFVHYNSTSEDRYHSDEEDIIEQNAWAVDGKSKKWF